MGSEALVLDVLWTIELLGGLRAVRREETVARFRTRKAAALLAYLAFRLGQPAPTRDALIEILWPYTDPDAGLARLAVELSALRRQLEPPGIPRGAIVKADRYTVSLDPENVATDVIAFETLLRRAQAFPKSDERTGILSEAVRQYGGALLPEIDGDWIEPERERLATRFLATAGEAVDELLRQGATREADEVALIATQRERLREAAHVLRLRCEIAAGRPEEALRRFDELTRILRESADESPGAESHRLATEARRLAGNSSDTASTSVASVAATAPTDQRKVGSAAGKPRTAVSTPAGIQPPATTPTALPLGIAAILSTDIEGSTGLGRSLGDDLFAKVLAKHHALLREEFSRAGGREFQEAGDGFWVAFPQARDALLCARACQQAITTCFGASNADGLPPIRVRMAIHVADLRYVDVGKHDGMPGSYRGLALHDLSRLLSAANGGQIFISESAHAVLRRDVPPGITLRDLGRYSLRDAPGPETIYEAVWEDNAARAELSAPRAHRMRAAVLPPTLTRFFGREAELSAIIRTLSGGEPAEAARLLTLTGMGGSGKTRLAIEAARRLADGRFNGAVWFVSLAETNDPIRVPNALRSVVAPDAAGGAHVWEALAVALADGPALLVLDNLEHLLDVPSADETFSTPAFLDELLQRFPLLTCLATTRQRIGIAAEQEFPVTPLPTPPIARESNQRKRPATEAGSTAAEQVLQYAGVALFVDRARRARFDFQVTERNAEAVAALCARLEGIPLGLELAAAWARVLTPSEMLAQFDAVRYSRDRGVPARHRSLDAAIEGSYRLLDDDLRRFFRALSVFHGGWTLDAARAVGAKPALTLSLLSDLCDRSLVLVEAAGESSRYRLLETVRTFAAARLAEAPVEEKACRAQHIAYFSTLAAEANDALQGPDQAAWLTRLAAEHQNLSAALERMDRTTRLQTAGWLHRYWIVRGYLSEGRQWLADVLSGDNTGVPTEVLNKAINVAGVLAFHAGDTVRAKPLFQDYAERCRAIGDERDTASARLIVSHYQSSLLPC